MLSRRAQWRQWEPHIHAPGTVLNNNGPTAWDDYLTALERATPVIEAIAVTDYYNNYWPSRGWMSAGLARWPCVTLYLLSEMTSRQLRRGRSRKTSTWRWRLRIASINLLNFMHCVRSSATLSTIPSAMDATAAALL